jgi:hypothetical protein|tara:strand:- start:2037 stop:2228 length:192 start_codon:yes stop_codon:yes gene_type:complete
MNEEKNSIFANAEKYWIYEKSNIQNQIVDLATDLDGEDHKEELVKKVTELNKIEQIISIIKLK